MSKIICDVCGTSYQESAAQCPICGCARPIDCSTETQFEETTYTRPETYTYVKGGRFSKSNVQKRNREILRDNAGESSEADHITQESAPKTVASDKGLVIAVCALLLAIIAVVVYIAIQFLAPADGATGQSAQPPITTEMQLTATTTATTTDTEIVCEEIVLSQTEVTLLAEGETYTIEAVLTPGNTTEEVLYSVEDESVATVSDDGQIVAVAAGETIVTVFCGDSSAQLCVICTFNTEATGASTEPTVPAGNYKAPFKINKTDVSISVGETFQLKLTDANGEIVPVVWSAAIADICTVNGTEITGAMKGRTELSATYEGTTYSCVVRVR